VFTFSAVTGQGSTFDTKLGTQEGTVKYVLGQTSSFRDVPMRRSFVTYTIIGIMEVWGFLPKNITPKSAAHFPSVFVKHPQAQNCFQTIHKLGMCKK